MFGQLFDLEARKVYKSYYRELMKLAWPTKLELMELMDQLRRQGIFVMPPYENCVPAVRRSAFVTI